MQGTLEGCRQRQAKDQRHCCPNVNETSITQPWMEGIYCFYRSETVRGTMEADSRVSI